MQLQRKQLGLVQTDWEIQEGELQLSALSAKLSAKDLKVINFFMEGHPLIECGTLAGYSAEDPRVIPRLVRNVLEKPESQQFMEVAKRVYTQRAMQQVCYDKMNWMADMQLVLGKALGREKTNFVAISEGEVIERRVTKDDLTAAKSTLELMGKAFGWMTEKRELTVEHRAVVRVRDFSGKGNHLDVSTATSSDEALLEQINEQMIAETELLDGKYQTRDPEKIYYDSDDFPTVKPGDPEPPIWDRPISIDDDPGPVCTPFGHVRAGVVRAPVAVDNAPAIPKQNPDWD